MTAYMQYVTDAGEILARYHGSGNIELGYIEGTCGDWIADGEIEWFRFDGGPRSLEAFTQKVDQHIAAHGIPEKVEWDS